jgi:hypothetical protein
MFVFAVGIPEGGGEGNDEEDSAYQSDVDSKKFLLRILVEFTSENPKETRRMRSNLVRVGPAVVRENRTGIYM